MKLFPILKNEGRMTRSLHLTEILEIEVGQALILSKIFKIIRIVQGNGRDKESIHSNNSDDNSNNLKENKKNMKKLPMYFKVVMDESTIRKYVNQNRRILSIMNIHSIKRIRASYNDSLLISFSIFLFLFYLFS